MKNYLEEFSFSLTRSDFEQKRKHKGCVLWFYGLSGSGKSTIANALANHLAEYSILAKSLDGDCLRSGLCSNLNFTDKSREENIRRAAHTAKLFCDFGVITLASFITPKTSMRALARKIIGNDYIECYVKAPLDLCQQRDPKGFYKKALSGEIKNYTGLSSSFEDEESHADLILDTKNENLKQIVLKTISFLADKAIIKL